jgi:hypothetical protein
MKNPKILSIVAAFVAVIPLATGAQALPVGVGNGLFDVGGNAPTSSAPVSGVLGSGTTPSTRTGASFAPEIQAKVNTVGAGLTAASISGSQPVSGGSIDVDPAVAQVLLDVANSPAGSDSPALASLVTALGGGEAAQALAGSMRGLRSGSGSIDPTVLSNAAGAYNTYLGSLISRANVGERPVTDLESVLQSLPAGQKAAQVLLTKLLASAS